MHLLAWMKGEKVSQRPGSSLDGSAREHSLLQVDTDASNRGALGAVALHFPTCEAARAEHKLFWALLE